MTTMNLKGISWVGDMYNRFESMCVEVDEIIAQDTVKYVENQMLTVGATVKKFYSEVMEDLLLPTSLDPLKEANSLTEVQQHVDASIYEKTNVADADNNANREISSSVSYVNKPCEPKLSSSVEQQCVTKDLDKREDSEHESTGMSSLNADVERYSREESTCAVLSEIDEHLCKVRVVISDLSSVLKVNHSKKDEVGNSDGTIERNGGLDAVEENKTMGPALVGPVSISANVDETYNPSIASEIERGEDADNQGTLVFKQLEGMKLEESCVVVEKSEHSFKLLPVDERKSYKKKIKDVLFPRRWSKGKRDRSEQTPNRLLLHNTSLKPAAAETETWDWDSHQDDSLESDWELL